MTFCRPSVQEWACQFAIWSRIISSGKMAMWCNFPKLSLLLSSSALWQPLFPETHLVALFQFAHDHHLALESRNENVIDETERKIDGYMRLFVCQEPDRRGWVEGC